MRQRSLFPEADDAPNFEDAPRFNAHQEKDALEITSIKDPMAQVMTHIDIRILVNGKGETVKGNALRSLVAKGISPEFIELSLKDLANKSPRLFPPDQVQKTIEWVDTEWYRIRKEIQ